MAVSIITYTADGSTNQFSITFDYISQSHVVVTVDGTSAAFTFINTSTVQLNSTPSSGSKVQIQRVTPVTAIVDFTDGSTLFEADLDLADKQSRFISEEAKDIATDAKTTIDNNIADVNTVAGNSADISTVAGVSSSVSTVAGIAANVTTAAGNTTNINTVAANDANITAVGGISSNVTTVAGISGDVTAVANDATDIGVVGSNISAVTTAASNISAIQNASANAATATTKASEASSSASAALVSQNAAAASQVAAADSAAAAATALDNFDDRYLGSKTSDPTVDNDGNALVSGALYFNSTANEMRVYDGANWIAASSAGTASLILYEYTATSGQTTFSGADDNSASLSYSVGNIQVVMNGIVLDPSDFTATSGTSVVLASGAATDDLINIYAFKSFTVADTVSASAGGTFAGNVVMTGDLTVDTNTLHVDSTNNRVGVNNASPAVVFDVAGTGRFLKTDNNSNIILETTDTDGNPAPVLDMYRNSASPADGDQLGKIEFSGENSNGDKKIYGFIRAQIRSTTAGAESPKISLHGTKDGADLNFLEYDGDSNEVVVNEGSQDIAFRVETPSLTHALCTTSAGIDGVRIGTATSISDVRLAVHNGATGPNTELYRASTSTSGDVLSIRSNVGGSQTLVAGFEANGDVMSATQNVQAPSDIKLKQDIVDCTSQWDDIKALQLRNYRLKSHVVEMGDDAPTHLGVIAQEVEAAGMTGLVDDKPDIDGDFEGPSTKVVKYTMIYLKAVKALQEAMAKIETLEAKVAALEERT